jgi:hypothetical protein
VQRIYDFFGWRLDNEIKARMGTWLEQDAKAHHGAHQYTAAQFGLSEPQLLEDYSSYRDKHIEM